MNNYLISASLIIIIITFCSMCFVLYVLYIKIKNKKEKLFNNANIDDLNNNVLINDSNLSNEITDSAQHQIIPVVQLPTNYEVNENLIYEITSPKLLSRISSLSPTIVNALGKTRAVSTTVSTTIKGDFYKVTLEKGGKLIKVKGDASFYRAMSKVGNNINEHAKLSKIQPETLTKTKKSTSLATSATANIMNVASLVVGQYYMSEVNTKLEGIEKSITDITNFQQRKFKSQIRSLLANISDMSIFSEEFFEDDTIRNNKLLHLQQLKEQTTQLLEQVNLSLEEDMQKKGKINFKIYKDSVEEFESLVFFQKTLLKLLYEIGRLTFIFGKGKLSRESSLSLYQSYKDISENVRKKLISWQKKQIEQHKIILEDYKFRKKGFEGAISNVTGLIKDEWRYSKLDFNLANKVNNQLLISKSENTEEEINLYKENTHLLIRSGKTYLLLPEESKNT